MDALGCLNLKSSRRDTRDEKNSTSPFGVLNEALIFDYLGSRLTRIPRTLVILKLVLLVVRCETCHLDGLMVDTLKKETEESVRIAE